ncbi:MAG: NAD(P)-dependent oxidoreductase, partial [Anaerotardibacter sp.]
YEELLKTADIVSFNCALTPDTHHILNEETIKLLKPTAIVVNTARGAVIDTVALAKALEEGRIWGAGLDVFEGEPVDFDSPICKAPHTVLTSHSAYFSEESGIELRTRAVQAAFDGVSGRRPIDCINSEIFS